MASFSSIGRPAFMLRSISRNDPGFAVVSRNGSPRKVKGRSPTITFLPPPSTGTTRIASSIRSAGMNRVKQSSGS